MHPSKYLNIKINHMSSSFYRERCTSYSQNYSKYTLNKICPGRKNAENVGINSKAEVCLIYMNVFPSV